MTPQHTTFHNRRNTKARYFQKYLSLELSFHKLWYNFILTRSDNYAFCIDRSVKCIWSCNSSPISNLSDGYNKGGLRNIKRIQNFNTL